MSERTDDLERIEDVVVGAADAGQRLDAVLAARLADQSRAAIQRWIKEGQVEVTLASGAALLPAKVKPSLAAPLGARLRVRIPSDLPVPLAAEPIGVRVLFTDDALVVVDKPAGMVVYPSPGHRGGTLLNALLADEGPLAPAGGEGRPGVVHRLDRETSGVIVLARTDRAHRELSRQFKAREVAKRYLALVRGRPREDRFEVRHAIARSRHDRKRMAPDPEGRPAETRFEVLERFAQHAWIACYPRTGRTHQIRVHLHAASLPILCDQLYAPQRDVRPSALLGRRAAFSEPPVLSRHALHAERLTLTHPSSGARVTFEAPLPSDLTAVLDLLRAARV